MSNENFNWLRAHNRDRYIANLMFKEPARSLLMALHRFDLELAHIPYQVSEPILGEIRLQWWRDQISGYNAHKTRIDHPLGPALQNLLSAHRAPYHCFLAMIDARGFDLTPQAQMQDQQALKIYAQKLYGSLFQIAAALTNTSLSSDLIALCQKAGEVYGICEILKRLPVDYHHERFFLPQDALYTKAETTQPPTGDIAPASPAAPTPEQLRGAYIATCQKLRRDYAALRPKLKSLAPAQRRVFALTALVPAYLDAMDKLSRDENASDMLIKHIPQINPLRQFCSVWLVKYGNFPQ